MADVSVEIVGPDGAPLPYATTQFKTFLVQGAEVTYLPDNSPGGADSYRLTLVVDPDRPS